MSGDRHERPALAGRRRPECAGRTLPIHRLSGLWPAAFHQSEDRQSVGTKRSGRGPLISDRLLAPAEVRPHIGAALAAFLADDSLKLGRLTAPRRFTLCP